MSSFQNCLNLVWTTSTSKVIIKWCWVVLYCYILVFLLFQAISQNIIFWHFSKCHFATFLKMSFCHISQNVILRHFSKCHFATFLKMSFCDIRRVFPDRITNTHFWKKKYKNWNICGIFKTFFFFYNSAKSSFFIMRPPLSFLLYNKRLNIMAVFKTFSWLVLPWHRYLMCTEKNVSITSNFAQFSFLLKYMKKYMKYMKKNTWNVSKHS